MRRRLRRLRTPLGILLIVTALAGCAEPPPSESRERLVALDPDHAEAAALADLRAGRARYLAVNGRYAVEAPGAPGDGIVDAAILEGRSASGPCRPLHARTVDHAQRYDEALARLRGQTASP